MERDGLHNQVKERHWLTLLSKLDTDSRSRTAVAGQLTGTTCLSTSWFSIKIILGLGWLFLCVPFFFFSLTQLRWKGRDYNGGNNGYSVLDSWNSLNLKCPGILVLSIGKNSANFHLAKWLSSIPTSLCQLLTHWKVAGCEYKNPITVFHVDYVSHSASIHYGLPGLQAEVKQKEVRDYLKRNLKEFT